MYRLLFKKCLQIWIDLTIGIFGAVAITAVLYWLLGAPEDIALAIAIAAMIIFFIYRTEKLPKLR